MKSLQRKGRWWKRLVPIGSFLFVIACGDAHTFRVSTSEWGPDARGPLGDLQGSLIELARISSRCNPAGSDSLMALVGSHIEFPGEEVTGLKSPCGEGPEVRVGVDLGRHTILYDFSNVTEAGRFPDADFEGFVITDMYHSVRGIRSVTIDRGMSSMDVPDDAVSFDAHSVSINLAGMGFDPASFVKLDLTFDAVE